MLARGEAAPLRFLLAVVILWVAARGAVLSGWRPFAPEAMRIAPSPGWLMSGWPARAVRVAIADTRRPAFKTARPPGVRVAANVPRPTIRSATAGRTPATDASFVAIAAPLAGGLDDDARGLLVLAAYRPDGARSYARPSGVGNAATLVGDRRSAPGLPRLSGSAWAFVRGGGHATPLSPGSQVSGGQIGGGQAGARLLYRLDHDGRLAAAARLSRTIGGPTQSEAAVGLDWKPAAALPVHVTVERRVALDDGGRDAWALGAAGGVYDVRLAKGWRLDGYAEAGVVGARRRDLYADGAARIGRAIRIGGGASVTVGAGLWSAAQPGAARLDAGPSAVLRLPVERRTVAVALDYRARIAGDARPGSGVALTVGVDF